MLKCSGVALTCVWSDEPKEKPFRRLLVYLHPAGYSSSSPAEWAQAAAWMPYELSFAVTFDQLFNEERIFPGTRLHVPTPIEAFTDPLESGQWVSRPPQPGLQPDAIT